MLGSAPSIMPMKEKTNRNLREVRVFHAVTETVSGFVFLQMIELLH